MLGNILNMEADLVKVIHCGLDKLELTRTRSTRQLCCGRCTLGPGSAIGVVTDRQVECAKNLCRNFDPSEKASVMASVKI
jgi:hypothetical protein